ncbi:ran-binding protein 9-like [Panicum miliaceum]|uniref:Ran-binding protein 9-like n=1 Tax=Panicum miliaceum TaxID=4540 RepID=A0A3L6S5A7_PANMI|nr:ran-binding protein 9-like [Panicum miliaceum]
MARGLRGVRDDLSELGRHLLDIACFLHPLLNPAHTDSPPATPTTGGGRRPPPRAARRSPSPHPPSPSLLAGILSDLAEIGGSLRGGFSRAATQHDHPAAAESLHAAASPPASPPPPAAAAAAQVPDDVVGAARALAARPEAWIDFPVLALDENSVISDIQRDHLESIEKLVPDLASLRTRLCPSYMDEDVFWKIYFRLLESNINEHSSEEDNRSVPNSVHHINEIESDSPPHVCEIESVKSNQEGYLSSDGQAFPKTRSERSIDQWVFAKSKSEESMDQWSEIPSDVESFREGKRYLSSEELSDVDSANVVVMDKYMDSLLLDRRNLPYASSSVHQDSVRRKPASSTDYSHRPPQPTPPAVQEGIMGRHGGFGV